MQAQEFFELEDFTHREIFSNTEGVWTALNSLPDYLQTFFREPWPLSGLSGQINRPLVIHNGEVRDDCEIKATGPKCTMQAYFKGDDGKGTKITLSEPINGDDDDDDTTSNGGNKNGDTDTPGFGFISILISIMLILIFVYMRKR